MKRIISLILCLSMLLSMVPMSVFAAEAEETITAEADAAMTAESTPVTESTGATEPSVPETTTVETTSPEEATDPEEPTDPEVPTVPEEPTDPEEPTVPEGFYAAEAITWTPDTDFPSSEELFAGYVEQEFYGNSVATFGTNGRNQLSGADLLIYNALAKQIKKIATGERSSSVIAVGQDLGDLTFDYEDGTSVTYSCHVDPEDVVDISGAELNISKLLEILLQDFPYELYWFDKTWGISCVPITDYGELVCCVFFFSVSEDYSATGQLGTTDVNTTLTSATSTAVENAQQIVDNYLSASDYAKLKGYMQTVWDLSDYNFDAVYENWEYGDPWQLIWVFDNDPNTKVVCEGYSKAFQYLCDKSDFFNDILCYSVVGYLAPEFPGDGAHMWNIVQVNGDSYLVDVTNTSRDGSLFLKGGVIQKGCYGFDYNTGNYYNLPEVYGTYTISGLDFVYDIETIENWGADVTTLATSDLTEANFPAVPEVPMTGEGLVELLENQTGHTYYLYEPVVIDSDIELPIRSLQVWGNGSITVTENGSLTVSATYYDGSLVNANLLSIANGGRLTVEEGGELIINGELSVAGGGTVIVDGTYTCDGRVTLGNFAFLEGIAASDIHYDASVFDEVSLLDALNCTGYASHTVRFTGIDMDNDGALEPVVLTKDATIPEGCKLEVGTDYGAVVTLEVPNGVRLTNDGGSLIVRNGATLAVEGNLDCYGATLTVQDGGKMILSGDGYLFFPSGVLTIEDGASYEILDNAEIYAAMGTELIGISKSEVTNSNFIEDPADNLQEIAEAQGESYKKFYLSIATDYTVSEDMTIPANVELQMAGNTLTVTDGATLTLTDFEVGMYVPEEGGLDVPGHIVVEDGTLNVLGQLDLLYGSTLKVADGRGTVTGNVNGSVENYVPTMTAADLIEALENCDEPNYHLDSAVVITDAVSLPAFHNGNPGVLNITGNGSITVKAGGSLTTDNSLDVNYGGKLTVEEGGELAVDGILSAGVYGTITIDGACTLGQNSWVVQNYPSTISGIDPSVIHLYAIAWNEASLAEILALQGYASQELILSGWDMDDNDQPDPIVLTEDLVIPASWPIVIGDEMGIAASLVVSKNVTLTVDSSISIWHGASLILEEGASIKGSGQICSDGTVINSGTLGLPVQGHGSVQHMSQNSLQNSLYAVDGTVYLNNAITLTKDLTVPAGAQLVIADRGSITIPAGRRLANNGEILVASAGSITAAGGGVIANNGVIRNEGTMDMTECVYRHGENAELIMVITSNAGTGSLYNLICGNEADIRRYVTVRVESDDLAQIYNTLNAYWYVGPKAMEIYVTGDLTVTDYYKDFTVPPYATLYIGSTENPVNVTFPGNAVLTNAGSIRIADGSALTLEKGATFQGNLPVRESGGVFENKTAAVLSAATADTSITKPTYVPAGTTLEIPADVKLTISGIGTYLLLEEGAELINNGTIIVEQKAVLDTNYGTYTNNGSTVVAKNSTLDVSSEEDAYVNNGDVTASFYCDKTGTVSKSNLLDAEATGIIVETESDDAIVREVIAYTETLNETPSLDIIFSGTTVLSGDLDLPSDSNTVVSEEGVLIVPENVNLLNWGNMVVKGRLEISGWVDSVDLPIYLMDEDCVDNLDRCGYYVISGLPLEYIYVYASQETALVGEEIYIDLDGWYPEHANYTGDYTISCDNEDCQLDEDNLTVTADNPCEVTVTVTATDIGGNPLVDSEGYEISSSVRLTFVDKKVTLFNYDTNEPIDENSNLILYAGNSLRLYGNLTGIPGEIDPALELLSFESPYENVATVSIVDGIFTITAVKDLGPSAPLSFRIGYPEDPEDYEPFAVAAECFVNLHPKATSVDIFHNQKIVTGQTVQIDLNAFPEGEDKIAFLEAMATPTDAFSWDIPILWTSSDENIATVDEYGTVAFTGTKTGKVKITMTTNFGVKKTASVTFNAVKLVQAIAPIATNADKLIGGSSATYTVYDLSDPNMKALKSSLVKWSLCDENGNPITSHPYASINAAGKLTTKAVLDQIDVHLMATVVGNENAVAYMTVELYPAPTSAQIMVGDTPISGTLLYDTDKLGSVYSLNYSAGLYEEDVVKSVAWKSSATKVATIDQEGLIEVLKPGTAKFTLTVTLLNNKKLTATVTMKFGVYTRNLAMTALLPGETDKTDLLDYLTVYGGESIKFYAENSPENVTTKGVKWSVDNKNYATISSAGVLKAKALANPAIVTVLVDSKDGTCRTEIPVLILPKKVNNEEALVIYTEDGDYTFLTKATRNLAPGETLNVLASEEICWNDEATDYSITAADVEWTSSNSAVATVDANGQITAVGAGTAKITATVGLGRTAYFNVKVTKTSVDVSIAQKKTGISNGLQVASGKSLDLVGTVQYTDGSTDTKVNWRLKLPKDEYGNPIPAATISSSGKLTAAKNITEPTTVTVYADAKDGTGAYAEIDVTILPATTGVEIFAALTSDYHNDDITNTTLKWDMEKQGKTFTLQAKTFPENAMGVTWKSSNAKVAEIDAETGVVKCLKGGTVTITATAKDGSGKKATFKLTVVKTMAEGSLSLPEIAIIGGGKKLTLTKMEGYSIDSEATNKTLTWTMAYMDGKAVPKTVATLSNGVLTTKAVKAPLSVLITAKATDGSGEVAECIVVIYPLIKGINLYYYDDMTWEMRSANSKTISVPINRSLTILPDATNFKGFGYTDDCTADEFLVPYPNSAWDLIWDVTVSNEDAVTWAFDDGIAMNVYAADATVGQTVKITLKAKDGSNKSAYFTIRFTEPVAEQLEVSLLGHNSGHSETWYMVNEEDYWREFEESTDFTMSVSTVYDTSIQKYAFMDILSQNPDYIVLDPAVSSGWEDQLTAAQDAGIPVIIAGNPIDADPSLYAASVCNDPVNEGRLTGEWLEECLAGKEANILVISGEADSPLTIGRSAGFDEIAQNHPEWTILDSQCGSFTQDGGYEAMTNLVNTYGFPGFDVVICHNEAMAYGAQDALYAAGIPVGSACDGYEVMLLTYDASREGLQQVLNNGIQCNVESNPFFAEEVLEVIRKIENGESYDFATSFESRTFIAPGIDSALGTTVTQEILDSRPF